MTLVVHYLDPQQHDDNVLLRRYRLNEMAPEEAAAFEQRLFREPALCEALEIDQVLAACLQTVSAYDGPVAPETPCSEPLSAVAGA